MLVVEIIIYLLTYLFTHLSTHLFIIRYCCDDALLHIRLSVVSECLFVPSLLLAVPDASSWLHGVSSAQGGKERSVSSQNITISTRFDDKVDDLFWFRAQLGSSTDSPLPLVETSVRLSDLVFSDGEVDAAKVDATVDALLEQLVLKD